MFIEKHYSVKQQRVLQLLHVMQSHRVAFTWAFIPSAFAVSDCRDLVYIYLVWPFPDAAAAVRKHCVAHSEFNTPVMYRKETCLANITGNLVEVCALQLLWNSRKNHEILFLWRLFICSVTRGRISREHKHATLAWSHRRASLQSIITLRSHYKFFSNKCTS